MSLIEILPIIVGITLIITLSLVLFPSILKHRVNKLFDIQMTLKESLKISYPYVFIYIVMFEIFNIAGVFISGLMHTFGGFIGLIVGVFIMQYSLKKKLIKEGLEEEMAKKLSGSTTSYFFGINLLLAFLYIVLLTTLISYS